MIWQGIGIAPDRYAFVLLLGSLLVKRTRQFLLDWLPFLFLLISYDFLRSLAGSPIVPVHYLELIRADYILFGLLPTIFLQNIFFSQGYLHWYDFLATILYFLHFAIPLVFAFLLWMFSRAYFREFVTGILLLSYGAWITFVVFPAAPPWLASQHGYISGVVKVLDLTLNEFPERLSLPTIYHNFNPNPTAAIPSLHAAYPFLVFLFALYSFKRKALFFFPYVAAVWVSIVYLGEHYVIDILVGVLYATISYLLSHYVMHRFNWTKIFKRII